MFEPYKTFQDEVHDLLIFGIFFVYVFMRLYVYMYCNDLFKEC